MATHFRAVRRARRGASGWPALAVIERPAGLAFAACQAQASHASGLAQDVTVALQGTCLSPGAPAEAWASLGQLTLTAAEPAAFLPGTGKLLDLTPFRWLRLVASGGAADTVLTAVLDGDTHP